MQRLNLIGQVFGRLEVKEYAGVDKHQSSLWKCQCQCGKEVTVLASNLTRGRQVSCGCYHKEKMASLIGEKSPNFVHGESSSRKGKPASTEHKSWDSMLRRCNNPNSDHYQWYGGRGIKVCKRWQGKHGYENFLKDMGRKPEGYTLNRIDNDGDYKPSNCEWAPPKAQAKNRRNGWITRRKKQEAAV